MAELDCQTCGACCFSDNPESVRVTGDDHARMGDAAERYTHFRGNRCYLRLLGPHCAALTHDGGRFACAIYDVRPDVCRNLVRGSAACRAERHQKLARAEAARTAADCANPHET